MLGKNPQAFEGQGSMMVVVQSNWRIYWVRDSTRASTASVMLFPWIGLLLGLIDTVHHAGRIVGGLVPNCVEEFETFQPLPGISTERTG